MIYMKHIYSLFMKTQRAVETAENHGSLSLSSEASGRFTVARTYVYYGLVVSHAITRKYWIGTGAAVEAAAHCHYSRHIKYLLCLTLHLPRGSFASQVRCNMLMHCSISTGEAAHLNNNSVATNFRHVIITIVLQCSNSPIIKPELATGQYFTIGTRTCLPFMKCPINLAGDSPGTIVTWKWKQAR